MLLLQRAHVVVCNLLELQFQCAADISFWLPRALYTYGALTYMHAEYTYV